MVNATNFRIRLKSSPTLASDVAGFLTVCPHPHCIDALICLLIDEGHADLVIKKIDSIDQLSMMTNMSAIDGIVGDFIKSQKISDVLEFMSRHTDAIVSKWVLHECAVSYNHDAYGLISLMQKCLDMTRLDDALGTILSSDPPGREAVRVSHIIDMPYDEVLSVTVDSHLIALYQALKSYQATGYIITAGIQEGRLIDLRGLSPAYEEGACQLIKNIGGKFLIDVHYDTATGTMSHLTSVLAHHLLKMIVSKTISLGDVPIHMLLPVSHLICEDRREIYDFIMSIVPSLLIDEVNALNCALVLFTAYQQKLS